MMGFSQQLDKFAQDCGVYVVIDQSFSKQSLIMTNGRNRVFTIRIG